MEKSSTEKSFTEESITEKSFTEKPCAENPPPGYKLHACENPNLTYNQRLSAAMNGSLSHDQFRAAYAAGTEADWVSRFKPPLFTAALSLDSATEKAAAVEAALRAGADPNELDHTRHSHMNKGRVLAFFVNSDLHYDVNGNLDGLVNNLPAIEVMLRYGADPRQGAPWILTFSALWYAEQGLKKSSVPEFYAAACKMLEQAADALEERDRKSYGKGYDVVADSSIAGQGDPRYRGKRERRGFLTMLDWITDFFWKS